MGRSMVDALEHEVGELRAFVSDPAEAERLKTRGVKVAIGDVSDGSHVGGAALNAFCAVLATEAVVDDRERSFARSPEAVIAGWIDGLSDAGVARVIWLRHPAVDTAAGDAFAAAPFEARSVPTNGRSSREIAADVLELEALAQW